MTNIKDWNVLAADMVNRNVRPVTAAFYLIFGLLKLNYKQVFIVQTVLFIISIQTQIDQYKVNTAEEYRAIAIEQRINTYEAETGKHVDSIAVYMDKQDDFMSSIGVRNDRQIYGDALKTNWAPHYYLETYISDRQFNLVDKDESIENYFNSQNWTADSNELYIFKDNVLHICAY